MRPVHPLARSCVAALWLFLAACAPENPDEEPGDGTAPSPGTDAGTLPPASGGIDAGTPPPTTSSRPLGAFKDGLITYYAGANGTGNCGFPATPEDLNVAAIIKSEYQGSAVCGACAEIQGPRGTLRVRLVDSCPDCVEPGHLDLSRSAFAKLADPSLGRVRVKWRFVTCPVTGSLRYHFKEGSSQWWTALQVRNHHKPIRKLEWLKLGTWQVAPRQDYNYFLASSGMGLGPLKLRVTAWDGEVLEHTLPGILDSQVVSGASQFSPLP